MFRLSEFFVDSQANPCKRVSVRSKFTARVVRQCRKRGTDGSRGGCQRRPGWAAVMETRNWLWPITRRSEPTPGARAVLRLLTASLLLLAGCAFDISRVKQQPVSYTATAVSTDGFILSRDVKVTLGTGFPTRLKAGTKWHHVGNT